LIYNIDYDIVDYEYIYIYITRESEGDEVKAFIQHIVNHLDIKIRLFRYGDAATASLSRAVSKASSLASGKHMLIMNCDVTLQYGALRAMVLVFIEIHMYFPAANCITCIHLYISLQ
jgi:hypothetical protein